MRVGILLSALSFFFALEAKAKSTEPTTVDLQEKDNFFVKRKQVFTAAEFLYWTIDEGSLDYALRKDVPVWGPTAAFALGDYKIASFDWAPGVRATLGYYNAPNYWELFGQYTWIFVDGSNRTTKPSGASEFVVPLVHIFTPIPLSRAQSNINFHYHLGDLLASRVFDPNPHLRLRLIGGLTAAWIRQNWKIEYFDAGAHHDDLKNKWRFFGGGFRVGGSADWFWGCHLYLTGKVTFAALLGTYENKARQTTTFAPSSLDNLNIPVRNVKYNDHRFAFHNQFLLGPSYQQVFERWNIEVFAGYEFNLWFNLQEIYHSSRSTGGEPNEKRLFTGLIGLNGLTARLTLGF